MKAQTKKYIFIIGTLFITFTIGLFFVYQLQVKAAPSRLKVSFIDIGQGDSFLLESGGNYMLIDGGPSASAMTLVTYLRDRGVKHLDYVISTHPHEDHAGGLLAVVNNFSVGTLYKTTAYYNESTYLSFLNAVAQKQIKTISPIAGSSFTFGSAKVVFLAPNNNVTKYKKLNDTSIVLKVINGDNSFLFTADAELVSENEMRAEGYDLKSDVLKVGHHSALTSTSQAFLNAVNPSISLISCGKDHASGFPRITTLDKLCYTDIYRTDLSGTITMTSNGKEITVDCKPSSNALITKKKPSQNLKNLTAKGSLGKIGLLNTDAAQNFNVTFNSPFIINFSGDYGISSLDKIQYLLVSSSETFNEKTAPWIDLRSTSLAMEEDFYGSVYVKYSNKFGNEVVRKTNGFSLDLTEPTNCTIKSNLANIEFLDINDTSTTLLNTENQVNLQFDADFSLSGEKAIEYMIVNQHEKFSEYNVWTKGDEAIVSGDFTGRVYVRFTDRAGNVKIMKTTEIKIGKKIVKPVVTKVPVTTNTPKVEMK